MAVIVLKVALHMAAAAAVTAAAATLLRMCRVPTTHLSGIHFILRCTIARKLVAFNLLGVSCVCVNAVCVCVNVFAGAFNKL